MLNIIKKTYRHIIDIINNTISTKYPIGTVLVIILSVAYFIYEKHDFLALVLMSLIVMIIVLLLSFIPFIHLLITSKYFIKIFSNLIFLFFPFIVILFFSNIVSILFGSENSNIQSLITLILIFILPVVFINLLLNVLNEKKSFSENNINIFLDEDKSIQYIQGNNSYNSFDAILTQDIFSNLEKSIISNITNTFLPISFVIILLVDDNPGGLITLWFIMAIMLYFKSSRNINIKYEFENDEYKNLYKKLLKSLAQFSKKKKLSVIVSTNKIETNKKSSFNSSGGATKAVEEKKVEILKRNILDGTSINFDTYVFSFLDNQLMFLPTSFIIKKKESLTSIEYRDITLDLSTSTYIGNAPDGANIINYTYKHLNKDGSRNKKFSPNPKLAVYEVYIISFLKNDNKIFSFHSINKNNIEDFYFSLQDIVDKTHFNISKFIDGYRNILEELDTK